MESQLHNLHRSCFGAQSSEVLHNVVGRSPAGINRVLRRLPFAVLSRQGYLRLIELLDDPRSAKLLHHLDETEITNSTIKVLYEIPAVLRPVLAELVRFIERIERLDHLPDGLRWLVSRGAAASFDALIADLATQAQPGQFVARLTKLVAELPLPQTLPSVQIGKAASDRWNSRHLRAREALQELPRKFSDTDRCRGVRSLPVGRPGPHRPCAW